MSNAFDEFAIVELFGHQVIAGKVSEQVIGGQGFVRVDVPAVHGQEGFTKFFGPGAIYAITPADQSTVYAAVMSMRVKPVELWKINLRLPAQAQDDDDEEEAEWAKDGDEHEQPELEL